MSRIEDALKKLRTRQLQLPDARPANTLPAADRSAVPAAGRKKVEIEGPKHHIGEDALVEGGLLVPPADAAALGDEFRKIKRPLIVNAAKSAPGASSHMNVVMIASAMPDAGKTFCAVNLAVSLSVERELNVVLVDADVAKPHITREFGLEGAPGLIDLLLDENLEVSKTLVRTDLNDIVVLPAGRRHPHATELLASERMSHIVRELASRYSDRIIVLDSPPLLITSEAQALASQVGQIVLIVEAGRTSPQMLTHMVEALDPSKAINLVLNKSRQWGPGGYYAGDHAYYGHEVV